MATEQSTNSSLSSKVVERFTLKRFLLAYFAIAVLYIYAPMISLIVFSFNEGGVTAPFAGFTLDAYYELLANESMQAAIWRSIQLALVVTVITTLLGTAAGLAYRYDFWGQRGLLYLIILGIITPGVAYAIGAQLFLTELLNLPGSLWLAAPVHVVWTLPFAVIVILAGFPPNLRQNEEAAQVMGASTLTTYKEVVLPQVLPTVLGAAVFAFTLSYNEAERGLLLLEQDTTMPIEVFAEVSSQQATSELFALGSLTTVFSTLLLVFAGWLVLRSISQS